MTVQKYTIATGIGLAAFGAACWAFDNPDKTASGIDKAVKLAANAANDMRPNQIANNYIQHTRHTRLALIDKASVTSIEG